MAAENNLDVLDAENQEIISNDQPNAEPAVVYEKKVDDLGRAYATGKRKNAVERVWIKLRMSLEVCEYPLESQDLVELGEVWVKLERIDGEACAQPSGEW